MRFHQIRFVLSAAAVGLAAPYGFAQDGNSLGDVLDAMKNSINKGLQPAGQMVDAAANGSQVRGQAQLADGSTLTCFVNVSQGVVGRPNIRNIGEGRGSPLTVSVRTGKGVIVMPNNCDGLAEASVIVRPPAAEPAKPAANNDPCAAEKVYMNTRLRAQCNAEKATALAYERQAAQRAAASTKPASGNATAPAAK